MQIPSVSITYHKAVTVKDIGNRVQSAKSYLRDFCLQSLRQKGDVLLTSHFKIKHCNDEDTIVVLFWTVIHKNN